MMSSNAQSISAISNGVMMVIWHAGIDHHNAICCFLIKTYLYWEDFTSYNILYDGEKWQASKFMQSIHMEQEHYFYHLTIADKATIDRAIDRYLR